MRQTEILVKQKTQEGEQRNKDRLVTMNEDTQVPNTETLAGSSLDCCDELGLEKGDKGKAESSIGLVDEKKTLFSHKVLFKLI